MKRCLIIGCSNTKKETPQEIPALERYDGPPFRVLRRFLSTVPATAPHRQLAVYVLSAEFGLISGSKAIPIYDRRMTTARAETLREGVLEDFKTEIASQAFDELFLSMGKTYQTALAGYKNLLPSTTKVLVSQGGSGLKLTELKRWLTGASESPQQLSLPLNGGPNSEQLAAFPRGRAILQGVEVVLTPAEVYQVARESLSKQPGQAQNYKNWYVLVDETRVAPKWLVSELTQVPVSQFDASAARRVLQQLGVTIYRND